MDFKGCSESVLDDLLAKDDDETLGLIFSVCCSSPLSLSRLSPTTEGEATEDPNSSVVPGVFGVLADEPKDANAPEPSPNAEEAFAVGEEMLLVVSGEMALKGLDLP